MATSVEEPLKLQQRSVVRKGLSGLRQDGMVPAVIHNHGQPSIHVMAPETELVKIYRMAGKHHPLQLEVGSQDFLALIKDVHFNPVKRRMQHVVFQAIRRDEKVEAEVPISLDGEIPAERAGLQVNHQLDHIEIEALPANLPDELKVDVSALAEVGDKVTVADLQVPEGVTILTDAEHPIATVVEPKEQVIEEPEPVAAEGEEDAEAGEAGGGQEGQASDGSEAEAAGQKSPDNS